MGFEKIGNIMPAAIYFYILSEQFNSADYTKSISTEFIKN